jgi:hypothetical protein
MNTMLASASLPALLGITAVVQGYPYPTDAGEFVTVGLSGVMLGLLGAISWLYNWSDRWLAPMTAISGVAVVVLWSSVHSGVTAVRVAGDVVLAGDPFLARFVGVSPWLLIVVGVFGAVEPILPGTGGLTGWERGLYHRRSRRRAVELGATSGAVFASLSVLPVYLWGSGFGDVTLLGFSLGGGFVGGSLVGYLFVRHYLVTPILSVGLVTAAAVIAVTLGGSPRGFPTAWVVWLLPGLLLGGVEILGRKLRPDVDWDGH